MGEPVDRIRTQTTEARERLEALIRGYRMSQAVYVATLLVRAGFRLVRTISLGRAPPHRGAARLAPPAVGARSRGTVVSARGTLEGHRRNIGKREPGSLGYCGRGNKRCSGLARPARYS